MTKLKIKHFDHDSVSDGAKFEDKWTADKDYVVKGILIKRKDGVALTKSDITVRIAKDPLTVDHVQCDTFGVDHLTYLRMEEELKTAQEFEYEGYNREGVTIDLAVELILEVK